MKKALLFIPLAILAITAINMANAQTYDPYAVQVINNLIANNGLQATPNAPETWGFATWNDEKPKKIIELNFGFGGMGMKGTVSFAGLSALKRLTYAAAQQIAVLDLTDCPQLLTLDCQYTNYMSELILANCTQLQKLNMMYCQSLSKLDLTNFKKLETLNCGFSGLTKLILTNCTQLQTLHCNASHLSEVDLSGLDKLTFFYGDGQFIQLNLQGNDTVGYICNISLNNPAFENSAISYSDGILISADSTVERTIFTVQTNKEDFELRGTLKFFYSNLAINPLDINAFNVYPNPTIGELIVISKEL